MEKFVNPYNFVPFGKKEIIRKEKRTYYGKRDKLNTGWLDVALYTKTPLIIPDGAHPVYIDPETNREVKNPSEEEKRKLHKKYSFMGAAEGDCYIPGSELRGMVRSVFETVSNSCVPVLLHRKPISHRLPTTAAISKRGLLQFKENHWVLYSSIASLIPVRVDVPGNGSGACRLVTADMEEIRQKNGTSNDGYKTFLQYNIPVVKDNYHVAFLEPNEIFHEWEEGDETPYRNLRSVLMRDEVPNKRNNPNSGPQKELLHVLELAKKDEKQMVPVYYFAVKSNGKNMVYMSGSSIGRIASNRKWKDILGEHAPCNEKALCPACLLFGTIKGDGLKGHVRFTDARTKNLETVNRKVHTLAVLGGPRYSAFEFYFRRPKDAKYWNADFYSTTEVIINDKGKAINRVNFYHMEQSTPRGRKMYWHSQPEKDAAASRLNATMETVESEKPFRFKIYFDQITDEQLYALAWAVTLGDNKKDSNFQHKLGHAKPLGYGSAKLVIEACYKRTVQKDTNGNCSYKVEEMPEILKELPVTPLIDLESEPVRSLLTMCDVARTEGKTVMYPRFVNEEGKDNIFNWFTENRSSRNSNISFCTLPEPTDREIELLGSWNGSDNVINAKVLRVDDYGNILLEKSPELGQKPRIFANDAGNKKVKAGDSIQVVFKNENTNKNGITFRNYRFAEQ